MPRRKEIHNEPEYARIIREMHDQKSGDFDPKTMTLYDASHPDYDKYLKFLMVVEAEVAGIEKDEVVGRVNGALERIKEYRISPPHNTPENNQILEEQKKKALDLIASVAEKAKDYMRIIYLKQAFDSSFTVEEEVRDEETLKKDYDLEYSRMEAHDALIKALNVANDFLRTNFGEEIIDEKGLQGEALTDIEIFELIEREYVTRWAFQLVRGLGEEELPDLKKEYF